MRSFIWAVLRNVLIVLSFVFAVVMVMLGMTRNTRSATPTVTFNWTSAIRNTDGSALTDLDGYLIYVRRQNCDPTRGVVTCTAAGYDAGVFVKGLSYTTPKALFETCAIVQTRNKAGQVGPLTNEACADTPRVRIRNTPTNLHLEKAPPR